MYAIRSYYDCPSPFKQLSGVGVVMKLIAALEDGNYDLVLEQYADIVAVGTIADVVPLIKENRIIVKKGLELLSVTENPGVSLLMEKSGLNAENITSTSIAFSRITSYNVCYTKLLRNNMYCIFIYY